MSADAEHPWIGDPNDPVRHESARIGTARPRNGDRPGTDQRNDTCGFWRPDLRRRTRRSPFTKTTPSSKTGGSIPFDPEGARELLAEAGYPDGFAVPDYFCPVDIGVNGEVCQAVAGMWQEHLNLDVQIDTSAYTARRPTMVGRTINTIWQTTWGPNRLNYQGESGGAWGCCSFPQPTGGYNPGVEHPKFYEYFQETAAQLKGTPENLASREAAFDWAFEQMFGSRHSRGADPHRRQSGTRPFVEPASVQGHQQLRKRHPRTVDLGKRRTPGSTKAGGTLYARRSRQ